MLDHIFVFQACVFAAQVLVESDCGISSKLEDENKDLADFIICVDENMTATH